MAQISMRKITKKPADVQWWFTVEPEKSAAMKTFINDFEGVSVVEVLTPDPDTMVTTMLFDSEQIYGAFMTQIHSTDAFRSRSTYNTQNGVTETMSITTTS